MAMFGNRSVTSTYDKDKLKRLTAPAPQPIQTQAINSPTRGGFQGGANSVSSTFGYDPLYTQELQGLKGMDKGPKGKGIIGSFFGKMKDGSTFMDRLQAASMAAGGDMAGANAMRTGITDRKRAEEERVAGLERLQQLTANMSPEMQHYASLDTPGFLKNYAESLKPTTIAQGSHYMNPMRGESFTQPVMGVSGDQFYSQGPGGVDITGQRGPTYSEQTARQNAERAEAARVEKLKLDQQRTNYATSKPYFAPPRARSGGGGGGGGAPRSFATPPPF